MKRSISFVSNSVVNLLVPGQLVSSLLLSNFPQSINLAFLCRLLWIQDICSDKFFQFSFQLLLRSHLQPKRLFEAVSILNFGRVFVTFSSILEAAVFVEAMI